MITYHKLFLGSECNNDCEGCPVKDEEGTISVHTLMDQVDSLADPENLEICGGEPTLHRDLLSLIAHACSRGARRIKLVTNGRRLAEWDLVTSLVEQGCRLFEVKIFGSNPDTHETVTDRRGSFDETLQGLQNLASLCNSEDYADATYLEARVAVTRASLEDLIPMITLLVPFGVQRIILARQGVDFSMSESARIVANAMRVSALNRVWSVSEGFAPCLMNGCEMHIAELLRPVTSKEEKPRECRGCAYEDMCAGPPEEYALKQGLREFRPVSSSPYADDLKQLLDMRSFHAQE